MCVYVYTHSYLLFIYLTEPGLNCSAWDLWSLFRHVGSSWPGIEPGLPALRAQSLSHWTTREIPSDLLCMALHCHLDKVPQLLAWLVPGSNLCSWLFLPHPPRLPHPHPQPFIIWLFQTQHPLPHPVLLVTSAFRKGSSLCPEDSVPFLSPTPRTPLPAHPHPPFLGWILLLFHLPHSFLSGSHLGAPTTGQAALLQDPIALPTPLTRNTLIRIACSLESLCATWGAHRL